MKKETSVVPDRVDCWECKQEMKRIGPSKKKHWVEFMDRELHRYECEKCGLKCTWDKTRNTVTVDAN